MSAPATPLHQEDARHMLAIRSEHTLRAENLPFDIDVWYPLVREHTASSVFLPLTVPEAVALMNFQRSRYNIGKKELGRLRQVDVDRIRALEERIQQAFAEHEAVLGQGAFVRMCGRSPKDGEPLNREAVRLQYQGELQKLLEGTTQHATECKDSEEMPTWTTDLGSSAISPSQRDRLNVVANLKMVAMSRVHYLKVHNAQEVLSLLLSSERVFTDLRDWIAHGEPEQIVLRRWDADVVMEYEFRCFVFQGHLTAISQYDHYTFYPDVCSHKDEIQRALVDFWRRVHPCLRESTYVIDLAYKPGCKGVTLIEVSPFLPCTGPALFHWSNDREVLFHRNPGREPLEFRVKASVTHTHLHELVESNWESRWVDDTQYEPYWKFLEQFEAESKHPRCASRQALDESNFVPCAAVLGGLCVLIGVLWWGQCQTLAATDSLCFLCLSLSPMIWWLSLVALVVALLCKATGLISMPGVPFAHTTHPAPSEEPNGDRDRCLLFVYGTLKKDFHWCAKFLEGTKQCTLLGSATTCEPIPLCVGDSGVPYALAGLPAGTGHCLKGEVWSVSVSLLNAMDDYEGVSKGHYVRESLDVRSSSSTTQTNRVFVYLRQVGPLLQREPVAPEDLARLRSDLPAALLRRIDEFTLGSQDALGASDPKEELFLTEYSQSLHKQVYRPIQHIRVKQQLYLSRSLQAGE